MWVVYSETGERVTPLHSSEATEKHGKWLPELDAEHLSRCGKGASRVSNSIIPQAWADIVQEAWDARIRRKPWYELEKVEEPVTELEEEWEAQIETMDEKDFVDFMTWVWSDDE